MPDSVAGGDIVYSNAGVNDLDAYRTCSEANAGIAGENAKTVDELKIARKALVEAGQAQRAVAELRSQIIEDERQARMWERVQYWFLIVVFGAAAL